MIAAPSTKIDQGPHDPFLDYTQNIFAGLNFPEVPKNDVMIRSKPNNSTTTTTTDHNEGHSIELQPTSMRTIIPPQTISAPPPPTQSQFETGKIISQPIQQQKQQSIMNSTTANLSNQFALLYKNETGNPVSLYPSLSEMAPNPLYEEPPQYLEEEDDLTEEAPLITPTIVPVSSTNQDVHDEVMSHLLDENRRLQQQLQTLQGSTENDEIEALQRSMNYSLSQIPQSNTQLHQQQQLQPTIQRSQPSQMQTQHEVNQNSSQVQQQTRDTKYVCCGNCRQWLAAPKDATYVYCPGCESVNNCALAPSSTNAAPAPTLDRAPPRVLEAQPWYLQCFSKVLG